MPLFHVRTSQEADPGGVLAEVPGRAKRHRHRQAAKVREVRELFETRSRGWRSR
jgi:hypothetical protein